MHTNELTLLNLLAISSYLPAAFVLAACSKHQCESGEASTQQAHLSSAPQRLGPPADPGLVCLCALTCKSEKNVL